MKFAHRVLTYRIPIIAAFVVIIGLSIPGILKLNITVNIADFFVEGDTALTNQQKFEEIFGKSDFFGVLLESDNVFSPGSLRKLNEIGNVVEENIPYADSVRSIANLDPREIAGNGYQFNSHGELVSDKDDLDRTTSFIQDDPSLAGTLFSKDRTEAWVLAPFNYELMSDTLDEFEVGEHIYKTISAIESESNMTITAVGVTVYAFRKKTEMMKDLSTVLTIGGLIALILCILAFKSIQKIIAALSLVICSPVIVFGLLGWFNISADSAFISVPILLTMGVGIGNAVHINQFFKSKFETTGNRIESVIYAIDRTWRPVLFTVITTMTALLSFVFVQIKPIIWVGIVSASCIFVMYILCVLLFPVILSFGKNRDKFEVPVKTKFSFNSIIDPLAGFIARNELLTVTLFLLLALVALYGCTKVRIDFSAEQMMGTKLDHMKDRVKVRHSEICSNDYMDLTITGNPFAFQDSGYISSLVLLQSAIDSLPQIKRTSSILQVLSKANRLIHFWDNTYYSPPESQERIEGLYKTISDFNRDLLRPWTTGDNSTARIFIEMTDFSSSTIQNNIQRIDTLVSYYFPPGTAYFLSGYTYQMALMNQYITKGLVKSIGIALLLITILMIVSFANVRLGLIAMFPNLFPVIVCGAIIGYTNIPLEFVTMTVAPLILGLAVDDTIHFISSLKTNIARSGNYESGINRSYKEVGIAITKTTMILTTTFLVFTVSDIKSTVNMGILSCAGIAAAYLADIFVVPILIRRSKPVSFPPV